MWLRTEFSALQLQHGGPHFPTGCQLGAPSSGPARWLPPLTPWQLPSPRPVGAPHPSTNPESCMTTWFWEGLAHVCVRHQHVTCRGPGCGSQSGRATLEGGLRSCDCNWGMKGLCVLSSSGVSLRLLALLSRSGPLVRPAHLAALHAEHQHGGSGGFHAGFIIVQASWGNSRVSEEAGGRETWTGFTVASAGRNPRGRASRLRIG